MYALDGAQLDQRLTDIAGEFPEASVYCVDAVGAQFLQLPTQVRELFSWTLTADSPIELMASSHRVAGAELFVRCRRDGEASGPVRLANDQLGDVELTLLNAGDYVIGIASEARTSSAPGHEQVPTVEQGLPDAQAPEAVLAEPDHGSGADRRRPPLNTAAGVGLAAGATASADPASETSTVQSSGETDAGSPLVLHLDSSGLIVDASASVGATLGRSRDRLIGSRLSELVYAEDASLFADSWPELISLPDSERRLRCRYERSDGSIVWMEQRDKNALTTEHQVVITELVDVTDAVLAAQSEAFESTLFDEIDSPQSTAVAYLAEDRAVRFANSQWSVVTGLSPDAPFYEFVASVTDPTAVDAAITRSMTYAEPIESVVTVRGVNDVPARRLKMFTRSLADPSGRPGVVVAIDEIQQVRLNASGQPETRRLSGTTAAELHHADAALAPIVAVPTREPVVDSPVADEHVVATPLPPAAAPPVVEPDAEVGVEEASIVEAALPEVTASPPELDTEEIIQLPATPPPDATPPTPSLPATPPPATTLPPTDKTSAVSLGTGAAAVAGATTAATTTRTVPEPPVDAPRIVRSDEAITPEQRAKLAEGKSLAGRPATTPSHLQRGSEPASQRPSWSSWWSQTDEPSTRNDIELDEDPYRWKAGWVWLAAIVTTAIAALARLWDHGNLPDGALPLETDNATIATGITNLGDAGTYSLEGLGQPSGPLYAFAGVRSLLSESVNDLRYVSVAVGAATVLALFWLARRWFDPLVATASAVVLAGMVWHVHYSRIAFGAIWWPLLLTLALGLLAPALKTQRSFVQSGGNRDLGSPLGWLFAGALLGAGVWVSNVHWLVLFVALAVLFLWLVVRARSIGSGGFGRFLILALPALAVASPVARRLLDDDVAIDRFDQIDARVGTEWSSNGFLERVAQVAEWWGRTWWELVADPVVNSADALGLALPVSYVITLMAIVGVCVAMVRDRSIMTWLVLALAVAIPFGSALVTDRALRHSLALSPLVALFAGVGVAWVLRTIHRGFGPAGRLVAGLVAIALIALVGWSTVAGYFDTFANDPGLAALLQ